MLRGAATTAVTAAAAADLSASDHPTHSVVLGVAAAVVAAVGRLLDLRPVTVVPAVFSAIAVQPVLHLTAKIGQPVPVPVGHGHASPLHLLTSEAPTAGMQIVVPLLALIATATAVHLLYLLIDAVRQPLTSTAVRVAVQQPTLAPTRPFPLGSMLRWCGWVIRAARRGPPPGPGHVVLRPAPAC